MDKRLISNDVVVRNGGTCSVPVRTNFPDARSKFHSVRSQDGRFVLVFNSNYKKGTLTLSISNDAMVHGNGLLVGERRIDYQHVQEHDGFLLVAFAGDTKQKIEVVKIKISDLDELCLNYFVVKFNNLSYQFSISHAALLLIVQ